METNAVTSYRYRRWPLLLPSYLVFALAYITIFYSWLSLSYRDLAETAVMSLFVVGPLALAYLHLSLIKVDRYQALGLDLLYNWLLSTLLIFLLMLSYLSGEEWFGAIALLFLLFIYNVCGQLIFYVLFKVLKKSRIKENNAKLIRSL
jgi:hypothetical protein